MAFYCFLGRLTKTKDKFHNIFLQRLYINFCLLNNYFVLGRYHMSTKIPGVVPSCINRLFAVIYTNLYSPTALLLR